MKAVVYYSWTGKTARLAKELAGKNGAELYEIRDRKRPGTLAAYTAGCFRALRMKRTPTEPFSIPWERFDEIVLMAPIWAGNAAPAILSAFDALPSGKDVRVIFSSGSGSSSCREKIEALVRERGCKLVEYRDVKG